MTFKEFNNLTNNLFSFGDFNFILKEVKELNGFRDREKMEASFSLLFLAPLECTAEQGIYELQHEDLGTLNIFLVPLGSDEKGHQLEAIFN